jgi:hypothetical protein
MPAICVFFTATFLTICAAPALSAEVSYFGSDGYGKNGYSFVLSESSNVNEADRTIELWIDFDETYTASKAHRPSPPVNTKSSRGKGCFIHPYGDPQEIYCVGDAVPSIFRGVRYERRPRPGDVIRFFCTRNCSKRVPKALVSRTEGG